MFSIFKKKETDADIDWGHISDIIKAHTTSYTEDFAKLEQYEWQRLFVYNEAMYGHPEHELVLNDTLPIGVAFTNDDYTLWKKKLGSESFPIPLKDSFTGVQSAKIRGELYAIRPYQFERLDKYMQNGVLFQRRREEILFPYSRVIRTRQRGTVTVSDASVEGRHSPVPLHYPLEPVKLKAWIYVGKPDFWSSQLDGGYLFQPVKTFVPKKKWAGSTVVPRYYYFTKKEYEE